MDNGRFDTGDRGVETNWYRDGPAVEGLSDGVETESCGSGSTTRTNELVAENRSTTADR